MARCKKNLLKLRISHVVDFDHLSPGGSRKYIFSSK